MLWIADSRMASTDRLTTELAGKSGRMRVWPSGKAMPARTRATRCGELTRRQRFSAISSSLKAIASPALREPAPLVPRVRALTVAKVDSMALVVRK